MINPREVAGYHTLTDRSRATSAYTPVPVETKFTYWFENFFHPYVEYMLTRLNQGTVFDALSPDVQGRSEDFFYKAYTVPDQGSRAAIADPVPVKAFAFRGEPYAVYNREMFYHFAVKIAVHLTSVGRYQEALPWFHVVLDPTATGSEVWRFLPFRSSAAPTTIEEQITLLSTPDAECTADQLKAKAEALSAYNAILTRPFDPYAVAEARPLAYQYYVVMKYLDNLLAWGDSLFEQYTIESLNEATQIYVLAAAFLGERPQPVPMTGHTGGRTYAQLRLNVTPSDRVAVDALVDLETQFPFNQGTGLPVTQGTGNTSLWGIGRTLYFCVPANQKLLAYWDKVADRLYKIRHCENIQGVVQPLPLWDPPIDPGLLVKAAAAGIDIGSIVNGLNQPIGPLRSGILIQKALELAGDLRSLGGALLSALEKGDAEHLAVLRQQQDVTLQQLVQDTRFLQWKQAQEATRSLLRGRASALERYTYYLRLLGLAPDPTAVPPTFTVELPDVTADNFDDVYSQLVEQYDKTITPPAWPALQLAGGSPAGTPGAGALYLSAAEDADLNVHTPAARELRLGASAIEAIGGVLAMIPDFSVDFQFWGLGGHSTLFGGTLLAAMMRFQSSLLNMGAMVEEGAAAAASKVGGYQRRADDWILQSRLAARELMQMGRQLIGSAIAEQVAHREYLTAQRQSSHSQEVLDAMHAKFTNEDLYGWMQGELFNLHQDCYRFALDTARRAELTMKRELMRPELDGTTFVHANYWDPGRQGLLAGDRLYQDLKRMELAYHDSNRREYEMTRHLSLRQLDPIALLELQCTGRCEFSIPEWLFDRDCPGHYLRRIKSVALSIPAVVGPFGTLNCKATLLQSSVRIQATGGAYARTGADDPRFVDYPGGAAIHTSGGSNDSGMFEVNLHDERILPFEGGGVISSWRLHLASEFRSFDYSTISDVIVHLRYTAREGGDTFADAATQNVAKVLSGLPPTNLAQLFVLRSDFSTEWAAFAAGQADLTVSLSRDLFPYFTQGGKITPAFALYFYSAGAARPAKSTTEPQAVGDINAGPIQVRLAPAKDPLASADHAFLVVSYSLK